MKSKTSWFNPALFRSNLRRFAPLWGVMIGVMVMIGPMIFLNAVVFQLRTNNTDIASFLVDQKQSMEDLAGVFCFFQIIYAALCGSFCFKYLHRERGVYTLHALPLTRDCHFFTNLVSGLFFSLLPGVIACVLGLGIYGILRAELLPSVLKLYGLYFLQFLCFYGIAVFCMMLSGRTVIAVLSYGALIIIGYALPAMTRSLLAAPLFVGLGPESRWLSALSPALDLMRDSFFAPQPGSLSLAAHTGIWAAVGVCLMILSWFLYRRRQLERVGDAMVFGWAKWAFQLLFTWMAGLLLGSFLFLVLTGYAPNRESVYWFLIAMSIGLFVSWFAARMMLQRTIRVFRSRKNWLGYGIFVLAAAALILGLRFDVFGLQRRIPARDEVRSVTLSNSVTVLLDSAHTASDNEATVTDPELIARVLDLHRTLYEENLAYDDYYQRNTVTLRYRLKNGRTLVRSYGLDSGEAERLLRDLYREPEVCASFYGSLLKNTLVEATLEFEEDGEAYPRSYTLKDPEAIRAAILADAAAGRLPLHLCFGADEGCDASLLLVLGDDWKTVSIPINSREDGPSVLKLFEENEKRSIGR